MRTRLEPLETSLNKLHSDTQEVATKDGGSRIFGSLLPPGSSSRRAFVRCNRLSSCQCGSVQVWALPPSHLSCSRLPFPGRGPPEERTLQLSELSESGELELSSSRALAPAPWPLSWPPAASRPCGCRGKTWATKGVGNPRHQSQLCKTPKPAVSPSSLSLRSQPLACASPGGCCGATYPRQSLHSRRAVRLGLRELGLLVWRGSSSEL